MTSTQCQTVAAAASTAAAIRAAATADTAAVAAAIAAAYTIVQCRVQNSLAPLIQHAATPSNCDQQCEAQSVEQQSGAQRLCVVEHGLVDAHP